MIDLAVIGSGPAALTAGLYAARLGLSVKVFERNKIGGALTEISHLANFPGFDGAGADFAENLRHQVEQAGAKIEYGTCESIDPLTIDEEKVKARAIIIATGSEPRPLDVPTKTPISYCALCDAPLYKGKNIIVIGGGNSAVGETLHLAGIAKHVTLISHSKLKADSVFIKQLKALKNVEIKENFDVTTEILDAADGVFVFIGKRPATNFLPKKILDQNGYIVTDDNNCTAIKNVFAAGDVRAGTLKQAVSAAADGAAAAVAAAHSLKID
jgi:thioredoxin reductase (NADPH)